MKIYTKTGDTGKTSLFGGKRVDKNNIRIEAYGTVDELNSFIAQLQSAMESNGQEELLLEVQKRLFTIGAILASDPDKQLPTPDVLDSDIEVLEQAMDAMEASLEPLRTFILPGGSAANSAAHICRTVTRRAERRVITLSQEAAVPAIVVRYLNRLSDYFFMLSRYIAYKEGHGEMPWTPRAK